MNKLQIQILICVFPLLITSCEDGYALISGECSPCPTPHCKHCSSLFEDDNLCNSCMDFYYITQTDQGTKCDPCPEKCLCDEPNPFYCLCADNYYWDINNKVCKSCTDTLPHCASCDSEGTTCGMCEDSYVLYDGICIQPSPCGTGCQKCAEEDEECDICMDGYWVIDGNCETCESLFFEGCATCTGYSCTSCATDYVLDMSADHHKCLAAIGALKNCYGAYGAGTCLTCNDGYRRTEGGECVDPILYCDDYYGDGTCRKCGGNTMGMVTLQYFVQYIMPSDMHSYPVPTCVSDCTTGATMYFPMVESESYFCIQDNKCPDGFFKSPEDGNCYHCPGGCKTCTLSSTNIYTCTTCQPGYFHTSLNECSPCIEGCSDCQQEPNLCKTCFDGFFKTGNSVCEYCTDGCIQCTSSSNCHICAEGRVWEDNLCRRCQSGCMHCSTTNMCTECYDGLYLESDICHTCGTSCSKCLGTECGTCDYPDPFLMIKEDQYNPHLPVRGIACNTVCLFMVEGLFNGQHICRVDKDWCPDGYHDNGHLACVPDAALLLE